MMDNTNKKNLVIIILLILVIVLSVICIKLLSDSSKALELADEYKEAYEELQNAEASAGEYQSLYNQLVTDMLNDAALAEKLGNLTIKVWTNAIYQISDEESDKFTKENGQYVSDFNDALSNLYNDEYYTRNMKLLSDNQLHVKELMKNMIEAPEAYENAFKALEEMYNSYIKFTNIVLNSTGSLESYSNDFDEADRELDRTYHAVEIYLKY